jgi:hypothetical protein
MEFGPEWKLLFSMVPALAGLTMHRCLELIEAAKLTPALLNRYVRLEPEPRLGRIIVNIQLGKAVPVVLVKLSTENHCPHYYAARQFHQEGVPDSIDTNSLDAVVGYVLECLRQPIRDAQRYDGQLSSFCYSPRKSL